MKYFLTAIVLFLGLSVRCQTWGDSTVKSAPVFYAVEVPPKFPGGLRGYYQFLAEHLKAPKPGSGTLFRKTVQAKIFLDKTGKVIFAEIEKGIDDSYNLAVLEVMKAMPNWSPALQNDRPVPVSLTLPITFVD